ncbi:venom carboxylesterase-6 [Folsomia candida]|nr:venom carboxylesterase-6 [Folsomia candida]
MEKKELLAGFLALATGYLLVNQLRPEDGPIVEIENGFIKGVIRYSDGGRRPYKAFYKIPYASPPIGDLRFEPPVPAQNWSDVKGGSYYGSQCIQTDIIWSGLSFGSEDCLFCNVFVPLTVRPSSTPLPVMVYIHGGYWHVGSAQDHGEPRIMNEDVILVTFNYRLGALGFLSTGDETLRGNAGLQDQLMMLKWIQRNIHHFGGDPNRVTIFGESAGGVSVQFHILSPASRGLFHKAISQSGTAINFFSKNTPAEVRRQSKNFAEKFSCPSDDSRKMVECLKRLDAGDIVRAHRENVDIFKRNRLTMFAPTIEVIKDDKAFLTEDPLITLEKGNFAKIPWITGVCGQEGLFGSAGIMANETKQNFIRKELSTSLPSYLWYNKDDTLTEKIRDYYFGPSITEEEFAENLTDMLSDRAFFHPLHKAVHLYSKHAETYVYYFNYSAFYTLQNPIAASEAYFRAFNMVINVIWRSIKEFVFGWPDAHHGTCHGDELPLLFTMPWIPSIFYKLTEKDAVVSKNFIRLWTSFAKSDPLIFDDVEWKSVNSTANVPFRYLEISQNLRMIDEPFTTRVGFWKSIEKHLIKATMCDT